MIAISPVHPELVMIHPSRRGLAAGLSLLTLCAETLGAQAQPQRGPNIVVAASSFASVEVHVNARPIGKEWYAEDAGLTGPARIAISYGQPHARGRRVEGGLVPLDTVWRFGANAATTLHTDVQLTLGNLAVPRGDYSLYLLYSGAGWQLIVNRATGVWGTEYDASKDLGRVVLVAKQRSEPEEALSVYLVPNAARPSSGYADLAGRLRIVWGATDLSTTWTVQR
jgi:hypothetical protein